MQTLTIYIILRSHVDVVYLTPDFLFFVVSKQYSHATNLNFWLMILIKDWEKNV